MLVRHTTLGHIMKFTIPMQLGRLQKNGLVKEGGLIFLTTWKSLGLFDSTPKPIHEVLHHAICFSSAAMTFSEPPCSFQMVQERCKAGSQFFLALSTDSAD